MNEKKLQRINKMLDYSIEHIKDGKFAKAKPDGQDTRYLLDVVAELITTKKADKEEARLATKILKVANSYYQYSEAVGADLSMRLIPDTEYNMLVKKYGESGTYDGAYVPKDLAKKTSRYQELTSNLDKCYRFLDSQEVPDGVKEKISLKDWLDTVWDSLELSKNDIIELEATPKIDGVSVNSDINKSSYKETLTRGSVKKSGKDKDEEVSVVVSGFEGLLDQFAESAAEAGIKDRYGIAHEVFVTRENKKKIEEALGVEVGSYKSLRNIAAGTVNRLFKDKDNVAKLVVPYLSFYPTMASNDLDMKFKDLRAFMLMHHARIPHDMIPPIYVEGTKKELLEKLQQHAEKLAEKRQDLSYDIDGMVVTVVKRSYQEKLGRTGRKNQFQIAYKFEPNTAVVELSSAGIDIGAFGQAKDILYFKKPAYIQGVEYKFAHISKTEDFEELDPHEGDQVLLIRTGDAIPALAIEKSKKLPKNKNGNKIQRVKHCPSCNSPLTYNGKSRFCMNKDCPSRLVGRVKNILEIIGVEGLSDGFAEKAFRNSITTIAQIYKLTETDLFNFGYKSGCRRFVKAIQEGIESMTASGLIDSLGIDKLREVTARKILKVISLDDIITLPYGELVDKIKSVNGIDTNAERFAYELSAQKDIIKSMLNIITDEPGTGLERLAIAFSGFRPTKKEEKKLRELGYEVVDSKKFDVLVTDDTTKPKYAAYLKNRDTRKHLTSKEFYAMMEE